MEKHNLSMNAEMLLFVINLYVKEYGNRFTKQDICNYYHKNKRKITDAWNKEKGVNV